MKKRIPIRYRASVYFSSKDLFLALTKPLRDRQVPLSLFIRRVLEKLVAGDEYLNNILSQLQEEILEKRRRREEERRRGSSYGMGSPDMQG